MKHLLVLLMLTCAVNLFAQDVIVKKNGSTVICRVIEVNTSEVVYKKWKDPNGGNYILNRNDIKSINYENGRKEEVSASSQNEFAPGNQNSGEQSLNDIALMNLDQGTRDYAAKAKKLKIIGWVGGAALVAGGAICAVLKSGEDTDFFSSDSSGSKLGWFSVGLGIAGVAWTTGFLVASNRYQKMAKSYIVNSPLLQNEFSFNNGSSLVCSADLLKDNLRHNHTFGVGLRYNF
ncbi:MAG: hypothetical protein IJ328_03425 [Muribaculaceae bacterium]|nr:hypothetical protein [Muribaculaceae bacterium]